jgi:hypothetical protein
MHSTSLRDLTFQDFEELYKESLELKGGMGAMAWAVLEMFKRGGLEGEPLVQLLESMKQYFVQPSNCDCNAILEVLERRLKEDKDPLTGKWYRVEAPVQSA